MGTLMKIIGERALAPQMEAMDDLRKAKVKEFFDKAVVKCKVGSAPAKKAPTAPIAAPTAAPKKVVSVCRSSLVN